ncbi:MAG: cupin domain-containing protein [Thermoplasmata archaeon]|nr:cupin domain-containing protein [Thermoplasmata archaeon]
MKHKHYTEVEDQIPAEEGVKDTTIRWLITKDDGADNFAMRIFTIQPGGHTPHHQHDWEHEIFVVEGEGMLRSGDDEEPFKTGDFAFIQSMEWHQVRNTGDKPVIMLCLIPCKK